MPVTNRLENMVVEGDKIRDDIVKLRSRIEDLNRSEFRAEAGGLTCVIATMYSTLKRYREAWCKSENGISLTPRGLGSDSANCFVCGRRSGKGINTTLNTNFAAFAFSKEDGENIVKMLHHHGMYCYLDYRTHEPNWIQVKIAACDDHEQALNDLHEVVYKSLFICDKYLSDIEVALPPRQSVDSAGNE